MKLSKKLKILSKQLDELRFIGMDQNPKGIRDMLWSCVSRAEALERGKDTPRPSIGSINITRIKDAHDAHWCVHDVSLDLPCKHCKNGIPF